MTQFPRYAIYYAPAVNTALHLFGSETLGYDALTGDAIPFPPDLTATADWLDQTEAPRKYGFHATLKAPFPLHADTTEANLRDACAGFVSQPRAIPLITPVIEVISGFIAVIPTEPSAELNTLAQDCVVAFDQFRAPMSVEDRARRNPDALTKRQVVQLDRWGYPYVEDDFRFHMTLTGRIAHERQTQIVTVLRNRFARLGLTQLPIDRIVLFRQQEAASRFRMVDQFALTADADKQVAGPANYGVAVV